MTAVTYVTKKGMFDAVGMDTLGYADPKNNKILLRKGMDKETEKEVRSHEFEHIKKGEEGSFWGAAISAAGSYLASRQSSKSAKEASDVAQYVPYNISSGIGTSMFNGYSGTSALSGPYQRQRDRYLDQSQGFGSQLNQFFAPTRDQFRTGTNTAGNRSRQSFYDELLESNRFNNSGMSDGRFYAQYGVDRPKTFQEALNHWNMNSGQDGTLAEEFLNPQDYFEKSQASAGTDFDALNAETDNLFNNQGGEGIYDDAAFNEARDSWKSPEQVIYDRLFKMAEGNESLERSTLENRLFSQGMLGSTGGGHRTNALLDSQADKALGREQQAVTLAEFIQNQIQNRDLNANQAALGLDQAGLDQLRLGASVGTGNTAGANFINAAGQNNADSIAAAFSGFGNSLPDGIFNSPTTPPLIPNSGYRPPGYSTSGGYGEFG